MPKFLIEVPHAATTDECKRAVEIFLRTGSHFLTHAEWGCTDGEHKAWIIMDLGSKEEARGVVPSAFRPKAKIVQLNTFTMRDIEEAKPHHQR